MPENKLEQQPTKIEKELEKKEPDNLEIEKLEESRLEKEQREEEIKKLEERNKVVMDEIGRIRDSLPDLKGPGEKPLSVQENEKKIKELSKSTKEESAREKSEEIFKLEKKHCLNFIDSVKGLRNVFSKRNSERLNILLEDGDLAGINTAVSNIEDILSKKEFSKDEFDNEIRKITSSLQKIGEAPKQRVVREDVNSLTALISKLKAIREDYNVPIYWTTVFGGYGKMKAYEKTIA